MYTYLMTGCLQTILAPLTTHSTRRKKEPCCLISNLVQFHFICIACCQKATLQKSGCRFKCLMRKPEVTVAWENFLTWHGEAGNYIRKVTLVPHLCLNYDVKASNPGLYSENLWRSSFIKYFVYKALDKQLTGHGIFQNIKWRSLNFLKELCLVVWYKCIWWSSFTL